MAAACSRDKLYHPNELEGEWLGGGVAFLCPFFSAYSFGSRLSRLCAAFLTDGLQAIVSGRSWSNQALSVSASAATPITTPASSASKSPHAAAGAGPSGPASNEHKSAAPSPAAVAAATAAVAAAATGPVPALPTVPAAVVAQRKVHHKLNPLAAQVFADATRALFLDAASQLSAGPTSPKGHNNKAHSPTDFRSPAHWELLTKAFGVDANSAQSKFGACPIERL